MPNSNNSQTYLRLSLLFILSSSLLFGYSQLDHINSLFHGNKATQEVVQKQETPASISAQPGKLSLVSTQNASISAEVAKKSDAVQLLTTNLLQSAKDLNLIATPSAQSSSNPSVKGSATSLSREEAIAKLSAIASERKNAMLKLLDDSPTAFINNALPAKVRESLPSEIQNLMETEKQATGNLTILHEDQKNKHSSKDIYSIDSSTSPKPTENRQTLRFGSVPKSLRAGQKLKATGISLAGNLAVASDSGVSVLAPDSEAPNFNPKVAVVLINFADGAPNPFSKSDVYPKLFGSKPSVADYYHESSLNKVTMAGDVYPQNGAYAIPYTIDSTCDLWEVLDKSWDVIIGDVPVNNYTNIALLFPNQDSNCNFVGAATIGAHGSIGISFINGYNELQPYIHELGHNFGLNHAATISCGAKAIDNYNNCLAEDYADIYDTMSYYIPGNTNFFHNNGPHKVDAGWLPQAKIHELTAPGTYNLNLFPLEKDNPSGDQIIKIKKQDSFSTNQDYYYISFRQPIGYDSSLPHGITDGVSIHIGNSVTSSMLIDATPQTPTFEDSSLLEARSFKDDRNNIQIFNKPISLNGNYDPHNPYASLSIVIGTPTCITNPLSVSLDPSSQSGSAGQTLNYVLTVTNKDTQACGPTTYSIEGGFSSVDWVKTVSPSSLTVQPGETQTATIAMKSPDYKHFGANIAPITVDDHQVFEHYGIVYLTYVVFVPSATLDTITPQAASPDTEVTLTGTSFGTTKGAVAFGFANPATPAGFSSGQIISWEDTKVVVKVPSIRDYGLPAPFKGKIRVVPVNSGSIVSSQDFEFYDAPAITDFNPKSALPGTEVVISGKGFGPADKGSIIFGTTQVTPTSWSDTEIKAKIPAGATSGKLLIKGTNSKTARSSVDLTVVVNPTITTFSPTSGAIGTSVTITGTNFGSSKGRVYVNSIESTQITWSDSSIQATVPTGATSGKIKVQTSDMRSVDSSDVFTVANSPTTPNNPNSPPTTSTTQFKISGAVAIGSTDFKGTNRFSATSCPGKPYRIDTGMKITNTDLGNASWECSEPNYFFGTAKDQNLSINPGVQKFTLSPPSGYKCSGYAAYGDKDPESFTGCTISVTLTKNGGNVFLWFYVDPDTSGSGSSSSTPSSSGGSTVANPALTSFTPTSGTIGSSVTITGTSFGTTKATATFNGVVATVSTWSDTSIVALVPSGTTTGKIRVQTSTGKIVDSSANFTVSQPGISFKISGAVAINNTDSAGSNRFSQSCPGNSFTNASNINVSHPDLGNSSWECTDPSFFYGSSKDSSTTVNPGTHTFTLTPPTGYACDWYALYGDRDSESFSGCTITTYLSKNNGSIYVWFFVKSTTLGLHDQYQNSQKLTILNTSLADGHWLAPYSETILITSDPNSKVSVNITGLPIFMHATCTSLTSQVTCTLSGRPLMWGQYTIRVKATDSLGESQLKDVPLTIR